MGDADDEYECGLCGGDELSDHNCADELEKRAAKLMSGISVEAPMSSLSDDALYKLSSELHALYRGGQTLTINRGEDVKRAERERDRAYNVKQDIRKKLNLAREVLRGRLEDED